VRPLSSSTGWRSTVPVEGNDHTEASVAATVGATFLAAARFFGTAFTATCGAAFGEAFVPAAALRGATLAATLRVAFFAPAAFAFFAASLSFAACFSKRAADFAASVACATSRFAASIAFFVSARNFSRRFFAAWASRASTLAFFVGAVSFLAAGLLLETALVRVIALVDAATSISVSCEAGSITFVAPSLIAFQTRHGVARLLTANGLAGRNASFLKANRRYVCEMCLELWFVMYS